MPRPIQAHIDLSALLHNYRLAQAHAPGARAWAVVKANAYGHGLLRAYAALKDAADGFAMLDLAEAVALRQAGATQPLLLLEGFFQPRDLPLVAELDLATAVHCSEQVEMLTRARLSRPVSVMLKMNSGMNRLGLTPDAFLAALARLRHHPNVAALTLMTHFADADGARGISGQFDLFRRTTGDAGLPWSVANSATILRVPEAAGAWVRPGIMLYGGSPFPNQASAQALGLRPVMTLSSEIIGLQDLQPGERVGYGGTFAADRPMRVGVVACGYADGYPRHAPTGTPVLVGGQRTRTLGRVSMDMLAVDLSALPEARVGTPVVLWGEGLAADEVATSAGTISYELFCALAPRVPVAVVGRSQP